MLVFTYMNHRQPKKFSLRKQIGSTNHAMRGIGIVLRYTHNAWLEIFFAVVAVYLGWALSISATEWIFIVFAIGSVIVAEAMNTAVEIHVDLTNPETHPHARDTKDVAAGAVLLSAIFAGIVGLIIFVPKLLPLLRALRA